MSDFADKLERANIKKQADAWCKQWQKHRNLEPTGLPQGITGNPYQCVFANALGGVWNGTEWQPHAEGDMRIQIPSYVQEFISRFDRGEYPELAGSAETVPEAPNPK